MKSKILGIVILISGLASAQSFNTQVFRRINKEALNGFSENMNSGSARYIGMGGAMGALGGDISSVEQNPAGSGVAIASDVTTTFGVRSYKNKAKFGHSMSDDDAEFELSHFGASLVFDNSGGDWNRFVFGINYTGESLDNQISIGGNNKIIGTDTGGRANSFAGHNEEYSGHKNKFTLNFGASYKDALFLGANLNFHDTRLDNYIDYFGRRENNSVYGYQMEGSPLLIDSYGFSFSVGAIGKINHNLRVGAAYHSPVWNDIEEDFRYYVENTDGTGSYQWGYSEYDMTSSSRFVGSVGLVLGNNFAFDVDYTYHMYGSTKYKPKRYFLEENKFFDNLSNTSEIRIGGEYRYEGFKLRAGYNYVQSPYDKMEIRAKDGNNEIADGNYSDVFGGDINRFSAGVGYDFGGFYIDFAYQYQNQKYKYLFGNTYYGDNSGNEVFLPLGYNEEEGRYWYLGEVKENKNLFLLTLGWNF